MSSAPARLLPNLMRAVRGIVWTALFAVLAAGAAGLIAQASHPPGSPARADLTAEGDAALNARLDQASFRLQAISDDVDGLAADAKAALEELSGTDQTAVQSSLEHGRAALVSGRDRDGHLGRAHELEHPLRAEHPVNDQYPVGGLGGGPDPVEVVLPGPPRGRGRGETAAEHDKEKVRPGHGGPGEC